ncbi:YcxB family protein [Bacillus sonorensis]|nr:YcxB family protein [Bacillus sonorensis]
MQIQSKNSDTLFQWHEVTAVTEYKRLFLMKTSSSQLILIPKRYFTFENELHSFRQLVTEYGQAKKVKWQS